jgi:prolyl-tRNA editing enzyme YbaK/EbsC (Cys-tRNA(Pro) deacylase)
VTVRVPAWFKNHLNEVAEGYDMSLTEYLKTLVLRDAPKAE